MVIVIRLFAVVMLYPWVLIWLLLRVLRDSNSPDLPSLRLLDRSWLCACFLLSDFAQGSGSCLLDFRSDCLCLGKVLRHEGNAVVFVIFGNNCALFDTKTKSVWFLHLNHPSQLACKSCFQVSCVRVLA
jgi:hypothetical protein